MIRAKDWDCLYGDGPAEHAHHLTGTDGAGAYLDPSLTVPLCRSHHILIHQIWNLLGVGDGSGGQPDRVRLQRIATLLVHVGECNPVGSVAWPAETLSHLGRTLSSMAPSSYISPMGSGAP